MRPQRGVNVQAAITDHRASSCAVLPPTLINANLWWYTTT